jgi:hypothetical protein
MTAAASLRAAPGEMALLVEQSRGATHCPLERARRACRISPIDPDAKSDLETRPEVVFGKIRDGR